MLPGQLPVLQHNAVNQQLGPQLAVQQQQQGWMPHVQTPELACPLASQHEPTVVLGPLPPIMPALLPPVQHPVAQQQQQQLVTQQQQHYWERLMRQVVSWLSNDEFNVVYNCVTDELEQRFGPVEGSFQS